MAAVVKLKNGPTLTVENGVWRCQEDPDVAARLNKVDLMLVMSEHVSPYFPDLDEELAHLAILLLGGQVVSVDMPSGAGESGVVF